MGPCNLDSRLGQGETCHVHPVCILACLSVATSLNKLRRVLVNLYDAMLGKSFSALTGKCSGHLCKRTLEQITLAGLCRCPEHAHAHSFREGLKSLHSGYINLETSVLLCPGRILFIAIDSVHRYTEIPASLSGCCRG